MKKNDILNKGIYSILLILGLMVGMLLVWCLPNDVISQNFEKSLGVFEEESYSWKKTFDYSWGGTIDNAMDYTILSTAVPQDDRGPIYNAVYCNDYARYWHGYLIYIRPLLCFFSYSQIRYIFLMVHMCMLVLIFDLLRQRLGYGIAWGWIVTMVLMRINILAFSVQFSSVFWILYGITIYLLISYKKYDLVKSGYILLISGIMTSFIDLLTAPLITLGIPLIFMICINIKNKIEVKDNILQSVEGAVLWGIGYIVMWALKWPLMSVVLQNDAKSEIASKLLERSGKQPFIIDGREIEPSFFRAVFYNMFALIPNVFGVETEVTKENIIRLGIIILIILCLCMALIYKISKNSAISKKINLLPVLLIGVGPFIWFALIKEHSCIHQIFTYRILSVSVLAVWCFFSIGLSRNFCNDK